MIINQIVAGGGLDTTDATALASDIILGKTAYVATGKVTGAYVEASVDEYTKLLLHCDGEDGSTSIVDETGKVCTAVGTARLSNAQKVYGRTGLLLNGATDYVFVEPNTDFDLSDEDFTIDLWVYPTSNSSSAFILSQALDPDNRLVCFQQSSAYSQFIVELEGANIAWYYTSTVPQLNVWTHLAYVRNGSDFYIFFNGKAVSLTVGVPIGDAAIPNYSTPLTIGARVYPDGAMDLPFKGYMDEIRISKGIARWTSDFVPGAPYTGLYTQSATAHAAHIVKDYSAYARGEKIIGTLDLDNPLRDAIAIFPLDGSIDNSLANGNALEVNGSAPSYVIGKNGQAFSAIAGTQLRATAALLDALANDFTIAYWFKMDSIGPSPNPGWRRLVGATLNASYKPMPEIYGTSSAVTTNKLLVGTTIGAATYGDNAWHLGFTCREKGLVSLYVDNSAELLVYQDASVNYAPTGIQFSHGTYYLSGAIDQIVFWDRVLSSKERSQLWNNGNGLFS